ncbi:hypothetical protein K438DRAFT_1627228 [Mycena galopus ATCC 62051]|nr:hypothetical protein K438DRAFT_1627228 [Mycena galopus ATCC 62051]
MNTLFQDASGRVARVYSKRVDPDEELSEYWTGINKHCDAIPANALDYVDHTNTAYHHDGAECDEFGRYVAQEWSDQPDWYRGEFHYRGWIPLLETGDQEEQPSRWARETRVLLDVVERSSEEFPEVEGNVRPVYQLEEGARVMVTKELSKYRRMQDEIVVSPEFDLYTYVPPLFDIERVDLTYDTELMVHRLVADAKRSILEIAGFLNWWTSSVPGWSVHLDHEILMQIYELNLGQLDKTGYLISLKRDWTQLNFPLLIKNYVPIFYLFDDVDLKDPRFTRLNPNIIRVYLQEMERRGLTELWEDEIPLIEGELSTANRYDKYLQLKIDPYARGNPSVPTMSDVSGEIEYFVIDGQHWQRRPLGKSDDWVLLAKLYHHVVTESRNREKTNVIFQRFHRRVPAETLNRFGEFERENIPEPDISAIRERFKGGYAPSPGQVFDHETGDWGDPISHYIPNRNARLPRFAREVESAVSTRSHISIASSSNREGGLRRSASPEPRGRRVLPARCNTPPPFEAERQGETMEGLQARRARWLNDFMNWGRGATYECSLWRVPVEFQWNMDVLKYGYLIVDDVSEFWLRFLAIACPGIRFPRHLLEAAMERGIRFAIGFKGSDSDRFRPKHENATARSVTKATVDRHIRGPRLNPSPSMVNVMSQFRLNIGEVGSRPNARSLIARGGAASWILRSYLGVGLVQSFMQGPSVQVSVHRCGANDSGDVGAIDVSWDEVSEGDYLALFGHIAGRTMEEDTYLYPTDAFLEEYSSHYFGEWNAFCDANFSRIRTELDSVRAKRRTKSEWRQYFHSSNHGKNAPLKVVSRAFIDEGRARLEHAFGGSWNKKRICEIYLPEGFRHEF